NSAPHHGQGFLRRRRQISDATYPGIRARTRLEQPSSSFISFKLLQPRLPWGARRWVSVADVKCLHQARRWHPSFLRHRTVSCAGRTWARWPACRSDLAAVEHVRFRAGRTRYKLVSKTSLRRLGFSDFRYGIADRQFGTKICNSDLSVFKDR